MSIVASPSLHGRDAQRRAIERLCDEPTGGPGLVLAGEAGIGKSALLDVAERAAGERDVRVIGMDALTPREDRPLSLASELMTLLPEHDRPVGDSLSRMVADALEAASHERPLLLILDDAHRADAASWEALTHAARLLQDAPFALVAALPDGHPGARRSRLPLVSLGPLDPEASVAVVDDVGPDLPTFVRQRIVEAAMGNPLALRELASEPADAWRLRCVRPPIALPLSPRVVAAFAAPVARLSAMTQEVLLAAAASDSENLRDAVGAAAATLGAPAEEVLAACQPAFEQHLVEGGGSTLRFRSEVARSSVYQAASLPRRYAMHMAFVRLLADEPHRAAWHRAAASLQPDESLAEALEAAGNDARSRGRIREALATMDRAARVTQNPSARVTRLLDAADMAFEIGRPDFVTSFLEQASGLAETPDHRRHLTLTQSLYDLWRPVDARAVSDLMAQAEHASAEQDLLTARTLLARVVERVNACPADELPKADLLAAAERMRGLEAVPALAGVLAVVAPIEHGADVLSLAASVAQDGGDDPRLARILAEAAMTLGDCRTALALFSASIDRLRLEGRLGLLPFALVDRARAQLETVGVRPAREDAAEAARLAAESAQPVLLGRVRAVQALIAGIAGDLDVAQARGDEAERLALGRPALLADVHLARGVTCLAAGRYQEAYEWLVRLWDPAGAMFFVARRWSTIGELTEAAVLCGRAGEVRRYFDALVPVAAAVPSPRLRAGVDYARAMLAGDDLDADGAFRQAGETSSGRGELGNARLRLVHGSWLRRQRRVTDARSELRAALTAFQALGAEPLSERARSELRAAGTSVRTAAPAGFDELTAQERQIANLAASGLSNREIGQRLFLSHRTVSTHLYRAFPKLGVTSRGQLRDALAHHQGDAASIDG